MQGIQVRSFGNNAFAQTPDDLKSLFNSKYNGMHVTLVKVTPDGFKNIKFVSVRDDAVTDTYTGSNIDIDNLFECASVKCA